MTDITFALDPETARVRWTHQLEAHLGLIPGLLSTALSLDIAAATPHIPVSRGGSQFDRPQITGGGYYNSAPVMIGSNPRAAGDATYLWSLLADYATAVSEWLGADTTIPSKCPSTPRGAYDAANVIVGTLLHAAGEVWEHRVLDSFEQDMFAEIRRQQRWLLPSHRGMPQHARDCTTCGEPRSVWVTWVDGPNGSPKPVQVGKCKTCGQEYRQNEGENR